MNIKSLKVQRNYFALTITEMSSRTVEYGGGWTVTSNLGKTKIQYQYGTLQYSTEIKDTVKTSKEYHNINIRHYYTIYRITAALISDIGIK